MNNLLQWFAAAGKKPAAAPVTDTAVLAAHYPLEAFYDTNKLADTRHGNPLTWGTATNLSFVGGAFGNCLRSGGNTGHYATAAATAANSFGGAFSVAFWVQATALNSYHTVLAKYNAGTPGGWFVDINSAGAINLYVNPTATTYSKYHEVPGMVTLNTRAHFVFTYTAAGVSTLYKNGAQVAQHSVGEPLGTTSGVLLYVCADADGAYRYAGELDEVYLFNRVLTAAEVAALHGTNTPPQTAGSGTPTGYTPITGTTPPPGGGGNGSTDTPNATVIHRSTFNDPATAFQPHGLFQWGMNANPGSYSSVPSPSRNGSNVAKLELNVNDPLVSGNTRNEMPMVPTGNKEEWYAFSVYLDPATYQYDSNPELISQWHDTAANGSAAKLIYVHNDEIRFKTSYSVASGSTTEVGQKQIVMQKPYQTGVWLDFVFHMRHAHGGEADGGASGFVKGWLNGELKVDETGPNSWNVPLSTMFWKVGIYRWNWGSVITDRMLYLDEVRVGNGSSTYGQMVPWDGGGGGSGAASITLDTTDPTTLTGWEDQVFMSNLDAVGGVITVQNRRFRSLNSDMAALDFGEGFAANVTDIIIENCDFYHAGFAIRSWYNNNRVTVRNCRFWGAPLTAWTSYKKTRRAVKVNGVTELTVENCFMKGTAGISVDTTGMDIAKLRVRYNIALNIDSRVQGSYEHAQFLQLVGKGRVCADADIAWNYVLNEPNRSWVEDTINLYNLGGLSSKRIKIRNNFLKGAFYDPFDTTSPYYSGGGIIADSSNAEGHGTVDTCVRYVDIEDNFVVGSNNYSISVCTGRDITVQRNVSFCKGYLDAADVARIGGTGRLTGDPSGNNVRDFYAPGVISNIVVDSNRVGVAKWNGSTYARRTGYFTDAGVAETGRVNIPDPLNEAAEEALFQEWLGAAGAAGVTFGVIGESGGSGTPPGPPTGTGTVYAYPTGEANVSGWTTAPLWSKINSESEAQWMVCGNSTQAQGTFLCPGELTSNTPTGLTVQVRARQSAAGGNTRSVRLYAWDGETQLAVSGWFSLNENWQTVALAFPPQADLRGLEVDIETQGTISGSTGNRREVHVAWVRVRAAY